MTEKEKNNAMVDAIIGIECSPVVDDNDIIKNYSKIPVGELSSFGAVAASIVPILQNLCKGNNGEQLYKMIIPKGVKGVVNSVGNIVGEKGKIIARARFVPSTTVAQGATSSILPISPTLMLLSVAVSTVTKELGKIEQAQKNIIQYMEMKDKSALRGDLATMQEILIEYKHSWNNEKFKNNKCLQVQEIKRELDKSIDFYKNQIKAKSVKGNLFHSDKSVKDKLSEVAKYFKDYELAMYLFAFSSFLEVMLSENFEAGYLNSVVNKVKAYVGQYKDLHKVCCEQMQSESKTSVQTVLLKGVAQFNKALGGAIADIPKISDGKVDETLIGFSSKLNNINDKKVANVLEIMPSENCEIVNPFVENINIVNKLFNDTEEILFDNNNLYFSLEMPKEQ